MLILLTQVRFVHAAGSAIMQTIEITSVLADIILIEIDLVR